MTTSGTPTPPDGFPRPGRHRIRNAFLIVAGVVGSFIVAGVVLAIAFGGSNSVTPAATPAPTSFTAAPAAPVAPSTTPSNLSGPAGTMFIASGDFGPAAAQSIYDVTLDQVVQNATLGPFETLNTSTDHMAGAEFTITGHTAQTSDDANTDAVAVGSDGQDYQPSFNSITEGTDFDSGTFNVSPGQTVKGWVAFEVPAGVTVVAVQWSPGFDSPTGTWKL
jgi:hypothetical protein